MEDGPGGEATGGGDTWEAITTDADSARVGSRHGVENREREEDRPGGEAAGGSNTWEATNADADTA